MVIAGGMAILEGFGVYFGGPGHICSGCRRLNLFFVDGRELEKYFCGRVR